MATTVSLKIEGLRTVQAALEELPKAVQDIVLADALNAGAEVLKKGIADKIHNRTGLTARDLTVEITVKETQLAGVAAIGGTAGKHSGPGGVRGRSYILNFLERGARPHPEPKMRRRLRRYERAAGQTLASVNAGIRKKTRLAFNGKVFSAVKHPGMHAQAPMRITIGTHGKAAVDAFARRAWELIRQIADRLNEAA